MVEEHPYEPFIHESATVLILGSFPGLEQTRRLNNYEEWYYSAKRNKFWHIIEAVYKMPVNTVSDKKLIFENKGIAIADIILKAIRNEESNLDKHLTIVEYNKDKISEIIYDARIEKVYFTSKFVEKHFRMLFPEYSYFECLPSPSPRYARISLEEKVRIYKQKLPTI